MKRGRKPAAALASATAAAAAAASLSSSAAAAATSSSAAASPTPAAASPPANNREEEADEPLPPRDPLMNAYHPPLVGPEYQAFVAEFVSPPPSGADGESKLAAHFSGTTVWNPNLKGFNTDRRKAEALDKYLNNCDALFYKDSRHVTQDIALHFLHQCEYDIPLANRLLKPWQPPADPDLDLDEEEMFPADPFCAVCRDGGSLLLCDVCDKSYHAACVQLESVPAGTWTCPYHQCATCFEGVDRNLASLSCSMCPTSYCAQHVPQDLRARADKLACHEVMCSHCLAKEEEYAAIHRAKAMGAAHGRPSAAALAAASAPGDSCRRAFLHRLQMVLKREGSQMVRLPILGGRELDLYQLYTQVCKLGGIYAVLDTVGWKEVRRALRLPPTVHHQSVLLKRFYLALLYPYEKQFFPFFTQLPLKKALAENRKEDEEEEEELALLAQQLAQQPKKKVTKKTAAQQLVDEYQRGGAAASSASSSSTPLLKDDTKAEDVLVSLKVGLATGHASSMSKAKETAAARGKKKIKDKAAKDKAAKRAKDKDKAAMEKKAGAAKNQRAKRGRRGENAAAAAAPMSAAAALAAVGLTYPLKEHPAINIWTPTWWAHQANSSFGASANAARAAAAAGAAAPAHGVQLAPTDIQNAAIMAAMAMVNEAGPGLNALGGDLAPASSSGAQLAPTESPPQAGDAMDIVDDSTPDSVSVAVPASAASAVAASAVAAPAPSASLEDDVSSTKRKYHEMLLAAQSQPPPSDAAASIPSPSLPSSIAAESSDSAASPSMSPLLPLALPPSPSLNGQPNGHASEVAPSFDLAASPALSSSPDDVPMAAAAADQHAGEGDEEHPSKRRKTSGAE